MLFSHYICKTPFFLTVLLAVIQATTKEAISNSMVFESPVAVSLTCDRRSDVAPDLVATSASPEEPRGTFPAAGAGPEARVSGGRAARNP
jgi:hypothetical protein